MGIPVLILGESGSGKSASLRNFKEGEICVFNVANKPLPFRGKLDCIKNAGYPEIKDGLQAGKYKSYVVDDSQYLMAFELFDRAKETGYGKFTDIAVRIRNMINFIITKTPDDTIVYLMHHTETTDTGKIKAKTSGKMLDNQLTLEGLFSIVLMARTDGTRYYFETQSDGFSTCKSPMGMFEKETDNDLKFIDGTVRGYWDLNTNNKEKKGE